MSGGGRPVIPARRNHPPSRYPSVAIVLIDPNCSDTEPNKGRSLTDADQPFEVADGPSNPIRKLSLRKNFLHWPTSAAFGVAQSAQKSAKRFSP